MSATLLTILVGLGQGLLHGLGPDHCAAVATLGTLDRRRGAAIGIALRFAVGHALVLGLIGGGCLLTGMMLSESFEKWAEIVGGGVLVLIAVAATFFPDVLEHGHPHLHPHDHHGHTHAHAHAHDLAHAHTHRHAKPKVRIDAAAGALMAVSGVRSLVVAVPPLVIGGRFSFAAWLYLPAFALGVMLSMTAVGLVVSGGLRKFDARMARRAQQAIAIASAALGIFWIVSRV